MIDGVLGDDGRQGDPGEYPLERLAPVPLEVRQRPPRPVFGRPAFAGPLPRRRRRAVAAAHLTPEALSEFGAGHPRDDAGIAHAEHGHRRTRRIDEPDPVRAEACGIDEVVRRHAEMALRLVQITFTVCADRHSSPLF